MIAYKGLLPGLICRDYQFKMGLNVTGETSCAHSGFHCAEDPLDCLSYYGDINHAEYYIVNAGGNIDEDGVDSRVPCTELTILKQLTKKELFLHGLTFMADHPKRKWNNNIKADKAEAWSGYVAVRNADPITRGARNGDVLAFAEEDGTTGGIRRVMVAEIGGKTFQPGIWCGVGLERRMMN